MVLSIRVGERALFVEDPLFFPVEVKATSIAKDRTSEGKILLDILDQLWDLVYGTTLPILCADVSLEKIKELQENKKTLGVHTVNTEYYGLAHIDVAW